MHRKGAGAFEWHLWDGRWLSGRSRALYKLAEQVEASFGRLRPFGGVDDHQAIGRIDDGHS